MRELSSKTPTGNFAASKGNCLDLVHSDQMVLRTVRREAGPRKRRPKAGSRERWPKMLKEELENNSRKPRGTRKNGKVTA